MILWTPFFRFANNIGRSDLFFGKSALFLSQSALFSGEPALFSDQSAPNLISSDHALFHI
ncbi:hypothetical protein OCI51_14195 [Lysinibacillus capsici]|uniref:hypothetical protein n=1 Tax=Lysinibacillus capsici TaxID=2115968 RepID=UPI0021D8795A|nr:hypothetical protein [Lysinibacillus capsici]UYB45409.1 hypothetical protein OCI51_14195 [Lysinibacillus capsici]